MQKPMNWFLYYKDLRHERVKRDLSSSFETLESDMKILLHQGFLTVKMRGSIEAGICWFKTLFAKGL